MTKPIIISEKSGYLAGKLLVATPSIQEGCFSKAVIYICAHNAQGAMGVIVNQPFENLQMRAILEQLNIQSGLRMNEVPVQFGGPVETHRGFILHTSDQVLADTVIDGDGIGFTANVAMLKALAIGAGPSQSMLMLGYAGWGAGQLESEIENGSWIVVPSTRGLMFDTENPLKWSMAASSQGIDLTRFSSFVGHA